METAAPGVLGYSGINATTIVHHIYQEVPLKNILDACAEKSGSHPEQAYYFAINLQE